MSRRSRRRFRAPTPPPPLAENIAPDVSEEKPVKKAVSKKSTSKWGKKKSSPKK